MCRDVAALSSEVVGATGMRCGERMQEVVGDLRRASTWRSKGNLRGPYCSSWELIAAAHEGAQAGRTSGLAIRSELGCEGGRDVPQEVVGPGPGAVVQKSPRRLEVWDLGDAGEAASRQGSRVRTRRYPAACREREGLGSALAVAWQRPIPCPDGVLAVAAQVGDVSLPCCVPYTGLQLKPGEAAVEAEDDK